MRGFMEASYIRGVEKSHFVHVHSMRLATGEEALIARVVAPDGRVGYGFSFRLDATEARHMAEWSAGVRAERPAYESRLDHPRARAWLAAEDIEAQIERAFATHSWLPACGAS